MRIILFTGKGGVGKTTLSAATALVAAAHGHRTLLMSTDSAHSVADALDVSLGNEPRLLCPNLWAAELDAAEQLELFWGAIRQQIAAALRDSGIEAPIASELAVLPGLDEILALVRIKMLRDQGDYDLLVVDSAPTGAAMRLLAAPDLAQLYARQLASLSGSLTRMIWPALRAKLHVPAGDRAIGDRINRLFAQVDELHAALADPEITSVRLVLHPERMALRETQRAFTYMCLFGLSVDALMVNRIYPDLIDDPYLASWKQSQTERLAEAHELFAPLPVFEVPLLRQEVIGQPALRQLGAELYDDLDPAARLSREQPLRIVSEQEHLVLELWVSGIPAGQVALEKVGDELSVRLGTFRRTIALPQSLAGLTPSWARVETGHLRIAFDPNPTQQR